MSCRILIADADERWRMIARDYLENEGYEVLEAMDGAQAVTLLHTNPDISLVMLDIRMPVLDGFAACEEIRRFSQVPVLMINGSDEETELRSFACGADDCVSKPVKMRPLMARVNALLRRTTAISEQLELGSLVLNLSANSATVDGARIPLTPKEFDLLRYLAQNRGVVKSREQILRAVWNTNYFGDARTVDTHVKNLRMKLGEAGSLIRTVRGRGYLLA